VLTQPTLTQLLPDTTAQLTRTACAYKQWLIYNKVEVFFGRFAVTSGFHPCQPEHELLH
jgi:hypothetical protein